MTKSRKARSVDVAMAAMVTYTPFTSEPVQRDRTSPYEVLLFALARRLAMPGVNEVLLNREECRLLNRDDVTSVGCKVYVTELPCSTSAINYASVLNRLISTPTKSHPTRHSADRFSLTSNVTASAIVDVSSCANCANSSYYIS